MIPMSTKPTVSLLVPCYNAESYIADFIANMSQQTVPFDEVLFYDDASSDRTAELLRQQSFGRVIYGKVNQGPSVGRNILIRESTGQLIHFHDIDDWLEPTFLEQTLKALEKDYDAVITNIQAIDRDTGKPHHLHDYSELNTGCDQTEFFLTHCCYPINGLYRREAIEKIGGFREALTRDEDPDLHIRLAHSGAKFYCLPIPLAINRFGQGTYSSSSWSACLREHLKALKFYEQELPQRYRTVLCMDSAKTAANCAHRHLQIAYEYLDFYESLGETGYLEKSVSPLIKLLIKIFGSRNALRIRYGSLGTKVRQIFSG